MMNLPRLLATQEYIAFMFTYKVQFSKSNVPDNHEFDPYKYCPIERCHCFMFRHIGYVYSSNGLFCFLDLSALQPIT